MQEPTFETSDFKIYIFDKIDTKIPKVTTSTCEELIQQLEIQDHKNIAFVSAANSLGFMDGGSDLGYMNSIPNIQEHVRNGIKILDVKSELGRPFLHIGSSMAFKLTNNIIFIVSPTMFLPQKVSNTINPYYALLSTLHIARMLDINKIYIPMMCTGYGGFSFEDSFDLMQKAVQDYKVCDNNINCIDEYCYSLLNDTWKIVSEQPKVYMNTEFGVNF